jgi:hypothetical protein
MKQSLFLLLFAMLLVFSACDKEPKPGQGQVDIQFLANFDGHPLVMLNTYTYNDTLDVLFQRFNFYIAHIELIPEGATSGKMLREIDFVEFDEHDQVDEAINGDWLNLNDVPEGRYTKLRFGLGVPADLNATRETDYSDSHPLGKDSHYWSAWNSYIFTMINGKVDSNGDGVFNNSSILYHCGADETYRIVELPVDIEVTENGNAVISLSINLHELFREGSGYMNIIANPATHDINNLEIANAVMDNFQRIIQINN